MSPKTQKPHHPPRLPEKLLQRFCAPHLVEEIIGDLHERYHLRAQRTGERQARKKYWREALAYLRPSTFRRKPSNHPKNLHIDMIKNYFIIALRNLLKQKLYAFINIGGLAVGLACFILILLFVQHELSYDSFHEKGNQIYRVTQKRPSSNGFYYWAVTSPALANTLLKEFPEVVQSTTVGETNSPLLSLDDQHYQEDGILADERFFDVFTFPLLQGNPETALKDANSIVLTETLARKIFGDEDPMGRILRYQNKEEFKVTGVVADVPKTSHITFQYILPAQSHIWYKNGVNKVPWYNNGWYTYAVLTEGADAALLEGKMKDYIDLNLADWRPEDRMKFLFQPLAKIHLHSQQLAGFNFEKGGDMKYIYLFSAIGFVILLLACINYTNLAIARSIKRSREVGMRKVVGAARGQLIGQFLGESMLMTFSALLLALGIAHLLLPFFGHLLERPLQIDYLRHSLLVPGLLVLTMLVGLLSGIYPAFFMSLVKPIQALAGKQGARIGRLRIQRLLIIGQYTISIVLVVGSFVVHEQMQFMRERDLGYDREHILTVHANDQALSEHYATIRDTWLRDTRVLTASYSKHLPTGVGNTQAMFGWEGSSDGERFSTSTTSVDHDFLEVYGIQLIAGRGFSRTFIADTLGAPIALVNEATVRGLGWTPEEAIGQQFGYTDGRGRRTIIGVIKDFHYNSLHNVIGPLVLTLDRFPTGYISMKITSEDLPATFAMLEKTVQQFSPYPFTYQFLDDSFDQLYKREARLGEMFGFFTLLALLIASSGLFGLAAFSSEQRIREIGIRKVMGASGSRIVRLLSKDFLKLVLIAFLIASPIAWYAMHGWLQNFVYRIEMSWWIFVLAGACALIIALLAVSLQAIKASLVNPAKSLRTE
ncbi:ABC transporter permease [Fulvivirgaceae bacterium BMA12]|uniref:ABC transporter permease n=1 Tax=Agaribacillus aureus TaxID=3051825 RepID=A0ABT8LGF8_9BACT|nr:ABC transporter permease [Fulvivirgaceae bacterium BMA12]